MPAYNSNAQTWFIQLDAIFQDRRITSQQSKFAFVVEKLPAEVAADVADILTRFSTDKPYEVLRQAILHRTGCSGERTSKPSQLLRRMQSLPGSTTISDTVLKQMWLDKLQPDVVRILAALTDEVDIQKLATIADKILDTTSTRQVSPISPSDDITPDFNQRLQLLTSEIQKLSLRLDEIQNRPTRSRSNSIFRHHNRRPRSAFVAPSKAIGISASSCSSTSLSLSCSKSFCSPRSSLKGKSSSLGCWRVLSSGILFICDVCRKISWSPRVIIADSPLRSFTLRGVGW
ncbi:unnamed protein product [Acanthosepion pharaonis]|uniref:DUF7041 domain-containing protein n=1 Tax=Acanthosepion pharaonis TaxID=158019 RepID=A0A812B0S4_ACAPH|nr:unnamed protein product [Sepia pharaonis]